MNDHDRRARPDFLVIEGDAIGSGNAWHGFLVRRPQRRGGGNELFGTYYTLSYHEKTEPSTANHREAVREDMRLPCTWDSSAHREKR